MPEMKSITLDADQLRWAARAVLKAASKDDVTAVLMAVHFVIADGRLSLTASDRYRVHQVFLDAPEGTPEGEFLMQRSQAQWMLSGSVHRPVCLLRNQVIRLSWVDHVPQGAQGWVQVESFAFEPRDDTPVFTYKALQVRGSFPPVQRLFMEMSDEDEVQPQWGMNPQFLADLRVLTRSRAEPLRFFTPRKARKLAPMLVTNRDGSARALIQPNLLFDPPEYKP